MAESCLDELKKNYEKLKLKYKLPGYVEINEDFDIEKLQENETDTLLREIRKVMMDKVIAYLRFIEGLLNPTNAPLFFFGLLKNLEANEKKLFEETYSKLGKIEIEVIEIDNIYYESKEAEFIIKLFKEWQGVKKDMSKISKILEDGWKKKTGKKDRGYLG